MSSKEAYTDIEIDVLRELGNIGAGNAATSLSTMLNATVDMAVPVVRITSFDDAVQSFGGAENLAAGVLLSFEGLEGVEKEEIKGMLLFIVDIESANDIVSMLTGGMYEPGSPEFEEMKPSVLSEIGNIMGAAYINSIATLTGLALNISVPYLATDMVGAILSIPIAEFGALSDTVLFIEESFNGVGKDINSSMSLFAGSETIDIIMHKLGIEV
ncbi:MAG: chemotaxis protein CheC [Firmicutes bacterium]|nr:chemotaxis protein CheC [Bacillota bacterium]MBR6014811.1 chemotaxis protein CheC [Bacillota bacterium]